VEEEAGRDLAASTFSMAGGFIMMLCGPGDIYLWSLDAVRRSTLPHLPLEMPSNESFVRPV
jgi:hypothetical protein